MVWFYALPLLCMLPLFIIAIDWGRWLFLATIQFAFVYLILIESDIYKSLSFPFQRVTSKLNYALIRVCKIRIFAKDGIFIAFFFLLLNVPTYCAIFQNMSLKLFFELFTSPFLVLILKAAAMVW